MSRRGSSVRLVIEKYVFKTCGRQSNCGAHGYCSRDVTPSCSSDRTHCHGRTEQLRPSYSSPSIVRLVTSGGMSWWGQGVESWKEENCVQNVDGET